MMAKPNNVIIATIRKVLITTLLEALGYVFQIKIKQRQQIEFHNERDNPVASALIDSPLTRNTPITNSATLRTKTCFTSSRSLSPFFRLPLIA
jgi:hypothetical protein